MAGFLFLRNGGRFEKEALAWLSLGRGVCWLRKHDECTFGGEIRNIFGENNVLCHDAYQKGNVAKWIERL